ncbi:GntR family transcriptional regulator [Brevibacillus daliensis]|uniref:GntR family transcriptional regulator n=1 Tax=Brevibacillus daliensis TaxID=2892995 RepID=UPI001E350939|nr:GntR family transcriptional regulator [Brevibacillus daliensis]
MIVINERSPSPIYEQIIQQIKELILRGVLLEGEKLPSVREMSGLIVVNPNTVSKAYQELERQGVIETLRGKGTFVAKQQSPRMEKERMQKFREALKQVAIEATYLGIDSAQLQKWLEEYMMELRGGTDA